MEFEIDDQEYNPDAELPPTLKRAIELLANMPDGKLYTTARLAQEIKIHKGTVLKYSTHPAILPYRTWANKTPSSKLYFGNAETIKAFKEAIDDKR